MILHFTFNTKSRTPSIYREELEPYVFSGTVFRGMTLSKEQLDQYVVDSTINNTSILSTSKDKDVAKIFLEGQANQRSFDVLFTYDIHNNKK